MRRVLLSSCRRGAPTAHASAEAAVAAIRDRDIIYIHTAAATPRALAAAFTSEALRTHLTLSTLHLHTEGPAPWLAPHVFPYITARCLFVGANARDAVADGRASYIPLSLAEMPSLFARGTLRADVALISVSPPDAHGWCSLGPSCDITPAVLRMTPTIIAQVNAAMPRTFGGSAIHESSLTHVFHHTEPLPSSTPHAPRVREGEARSVEDVVGELVATHLIDDGATLQVGIGSLPDAVLARLHSHVNLGVHSELIGDGVAQLVTAGVVTNALKRVHTGLTVVGFASGSQALFASLHDNAGYLFAPFDFTNDAAVIALNPRIVALNSGVEVDLTGQVVADTVSGRTISGVGGQGDFTRGARQSTDGLGKSIIALPSITSSGVSRIVASLTPGGGVTTPRDLAHWVVTEHGAVDLKGASLAARARALISIAHPSHRAALTASARASGVLGRFVGGDTVAPLK